MGNSFGAGLAALGRAGGQALGQRQLMEQQRREQEMAAYQQRLGQLAQNQEWARRFQMEQTALDRRAQMGLDAETARWQRGQDADAAARQQALQIDEGKAASKLASDELDKLEGLALQLPPSEQERLGISARAAELRKLVYASPLDAIRLKAEAFAPQQVTLAPAFTPTRGSLAQGVAPALEAPMPETPAVTAQVPFAQQRLLVQSAAVKAAQDKAAADLAAKEKAEIDKETRDQLRGEANAGWQNFVSRAGKIVDTLETRKAELAGLDYNSLTEQEKAELGEIDAAIQKATELSQITPEQYRKTPYTLPSTGKAIGIVNSLKGILVNKELAEKYALIDYQVGKQQEIQTVATATSTAAGNLQTAQANNFNRALQAQKEVQAQVSALEAKGVNRTPQEQEALGKAKANLTDLDAWMGANADPATWEANGKKPPPIDPTVTPNLAKVAGIAEKSTQERQAGYESFVSTTKETLAKFEAEQRALPAGGALETPETKAKREALAGGIKMLQDDLRRYGSQSKWEADGGPDAMPVIDPGATANEIKNALATAAQQKEDSDRASAEAKLKKGREFQVYRSSLDAEIQGVGQDIKAMSMQPGVNQEDVDTLTKYQASLVAARNSATEDTWDGKPFQSIATAGNVADALIKARDVTTALEESTKQAAEAKQQASQRYAAAGSMIEALRNSPTGATNKAQVDALERRLLTDPTKGLTETEYAEIVNEYSALQKVDASVVGVMGLPESERFKKLQELGLVDEEGNLNDAGKKAFGAVADQKIFSTGFKAAQEAEVRPSIEKLSQVNPDTLALTPSLQAELRQAQADNFKGMTPKQASDLVKRVDTAINARDAQVRIKQYEEAGVDLTKEELADLQSGDPAKVQAVEVAAFRRMLALPPSRNERQAAASVESVDRTFALASPWLSPETKAKVREVLGSTDTNANKWTALSGLVNSPEWNNALNQRDLVLKAEADETLKQIKRGDLAFALQTTSALVASMGDSFSDPNDPRISKTLNEWRKQGVPEHVLVTASALIREQAAAKKTGKAINATQLGVQLAGALRPEQFDQLSPEVKQLLGGSIKTYKDIAAKRVKTEDIARNLGMTADVLKVYDPSGIGIYDAKGNFATPQQFKASLENELTRTKKELIAKAGFTPEEADAAVARLRKMGEAAYGDASYKKSIDDKQARLQQDQLKVSQGHLGLAGDQLQFSKDQAKLDNEYRDWQKADSQTKFAYAVQQDWLQHQLAVRQADRLDKNASEDKKAQSLSVINSQVGLYRQQKSDIDEQIAQLEKVKANAMRQLGQLQGKFDADPQVIAMLQGELQQATEGLPQLHAIRDEVGAQFVAANKALQAYGTKWGMPTVNYAEPNFKPKPGAAPPPYTLTPPMIAVLDKQLGNREFTTHLRSLIAVNDLIAANGGDTSILDVSAKEVAAAGAAREYFRSKGWGERAILAYAEHFDPSRLPLSKRGFWEQLKGDAKNAAAGGQAGFIPARPGSPDSPLRNTNFDKPAPNTVPSLPTGQLERPEANPRVVQTFKDFASEYAVGFGGIVGDEAHKDRTSDHNTWDAVDMNISDLKHGDFVASALVAQAKQRGVKYVIFNGRIWTPLKGAWEKYDGDPHTKHVHASFYRDAPSKPQQAKK